MTDPDRTAPHAPGEPVAPPPTVGRFVLGPELGRGAFGVVHRAYDPTLGREVAVKLPTAADAPPELVERFTREARAAAGLKHPHVVAVFDAGVDAGRPFIAMELVDGPTLADRPGGRPSPRQAAEWVRDLALALHHAHAAGVLHRDVKPGNVLLDAGGRVRLTDFGISKLAPGEAAPADDSAPAATLDGTIMGSPGYMSPEQARGEVTAVGPASDQYSLGVVLYELLTGRRPFPGPSREAMRQTADPATSPPPPRELDAAIPLGLEAVTLRALAKDPAARYATAADLAVDLQRWLKGDAVAAPLRLRGEAVRVCPDCELPTKGGRTACRLCGGSLADVPATDSADLPPPAPRVGRRDGLPGGATVAQMRAVEAGTRLLRLRPVLTLWAIGPLVLAGLLQAVAANADDVRRLGSIFGYCFGVVLLCAGVLLVRSRPLVALWAFGLLIPAVGLAYQASDGGDWPRYVVAAPGLVALGLLAVGQVCELIGLGCCTRGPAGYNSRRAAGIALGCLLAAPALGGYGGHLLSSPVGRAEFVPVWSAKESEPIEEWHNGQKRKVGMTKFEAASGPPLWLVCAVVGCLLGVAGWVKTIDLLHRLGAYLDCREVEGQAAGILKLAAVVVFGLPALQIAGYFLLQPWPLLGLLILSGLAGLGLSVTLLVSWSGLAGDLRDEARRRLAAHLD